MGKIGKRGISEAERDAKCVSIQRRLFSDLPASLKEGEISRTFIISLWKEFDKACKSYFDWKAESFGMGAKYEWHERRGLLSAHERPTLSDGLPVVSQRNKVGWPFGEKRQVRGGRKRVNGLGNLIEENEWSDAMEGKNVEENVLERRQAINGKHSWNHQHKRKHKDYSGFQKGNGKMSLKNKMDRNLKTSHHFQL